MELRDLGGKKSIKLLRSFSHCCGGVLKNFFFFVNPFKQFQLLLYKRVRGFGASGTDAEP